MTVGASTIQIWHILLLGYEYIFIYIKAVMKSQGRLVKCEVPCLPSANQKRTPPLAISVLDGGGRVVVGLSRRPAECGPFLPGRRPSLDVSGRPPLSSSPLDGGSRLVSRPFEPHASHLTKNGHHHWRYPFWMAEGVGLEPTGPFTWSQFSKLVPYHSAQPSMTQTSSEEDRLHRPAHPRIVAPGHPSLTLAIPGRPPRRTWRPIRRSPP